MVVISVPDHAGARPLTRELGLRRLRGSFRFPVFANGEDFAASTRMLFVPAQLPLAASWGFMLGRLSATHDLRKTVASALLPGSPDEKPAPDEPLSLIHRVEYGGRRYYPDVLVNPGLPERSSRAENSGEFVRTALAFLAPHQVVCMEISGATVSDRDAGLIASLAGDLELAIPDTGDLAADERQMVTDFAEHHSCTRAETDLLLRSARSFAIRTGGFPNDVFTLKRPSAQERISPFRAALASLEAE